MTSDMVMKRKSSKSCLLVAYMLTQPFPVELGVELGTASSSVF